MASTMRSRAWQPPLRRRGAWTSPSRSPPAPRTVGEIVDAGGQRISVGGGLTWVAMRAMAAAAEQIRDTGDLSSLTGPGPIREWIGDQRP